MTVRVLVVDDSGFFRRRVCEILNATGDIKVVATASNGREALELAAKHQPDVITMDYEMPVMDGITCVRHLMQDNPTPVLMFSSLTYEGARVTFDALDAGALDFLPKSFEDLTGSGDKIKKLLHDRILAVAHSGKTSAVFAKATPAASEPTPETPKPAAKAAPVPQAPPRASAPAKSRPAAPAKPRPVAGGRRVPSKPASAPTSTPRRRATDKVDCRVVLIGTSTGGPVALQKILGQMPANFPVPVVLVQHMPASFTPAFAERLNQLTALNVKQVESGEVLRPGTAYIAPGGKQTLIERSGMAPKARILEGEQRLHYKPCVDVTFGSAAKMFGDKVLGIILTGMGSDGRDGCRLLKQAGAVVWSQDEASSVIYGMPMAVAQAGLSDEVLSLEEFAPRLASGVS